MAKTYTHTDANGIRWRFEGARPVSEIADLVMQRKPRKPGKLSPIKGKGKTDGH